MRIDFSKFSDDKICVHYVREMAELLKKAPGKSFTFMEVCGTHTMAAARCGLKSTLPKEVKLISGPGCPVCVTPNEYLDKAIVYARMDDVIITTFGDMNRVPGTSSSLEREKTTGADIRIVYSPQETIKIARENPKKKIIFIGVGFETTTPLAASTLLWAKKSSVFNWSIFSAHKLIPPAMKILSESRDLKLDGFMCPGHVSTIIGSKPYEFIARDYKIPCVITGFEPVDIYEGVYLLLKQAIEKKPRVEIQYRRAVKPEGNPKAISIMNKVFEPVETNWRGIGKIPLSGLKIREDFHNFDTEKVIPVELPESIEPKGCRCGEILKGIIEPFDCKLFSKSCTPEHPVGACMVSSEGTCAAFYKYSDRMVK